GPVHGDEAASGQQAFGAVPELLDVAEDVIPAPAVEPGRVIAQLPQDLVRFERGEDGFDQDSGADRTAGDAERVLRGVEHVVPEACLDVALELRWVEIRGRDFGDNSRRVVEESQG